MELVGCWTSFFSLTKPTQKTLLFFHFPHLCLVCYTIFFFIFYYYFFAIIIVWEYYKPNIDSIFFLSALLLLVLRLVVVFGWCIVMYSVRELERNIFVSASVYVCVLASNFEDESNNSSWRPMLFSIMSMWWASPLFFLIVVQSIMREECKRGERKKTFLNLPLLLISLRVFPFPSLSPSVF